MNSARATILTVVVMLAPGMWNATMAETPFDRVAAWQRTVVAANEGVPNAAVMTYITEGMEATHHWILLKVSPALASGDGLTATKATTCATDDFPGGVSTTWRWGNVAAEATLVPALNPRVDAEWSGAAHYAIATTPPAPLVLNVGGGWRDWFHLAPVALMTSDDVATTATTVEQLDERTVLLTSTIHPLKVIVRVAGGSILRRETADGQWASVALDDGSGELYVAFAESREHALALSQPRDMLGEVRAHYTQLLDSARIETPDANLDRAFASAVVLNEYAWFEPLGWIESVHHWVTFYHQQHVGMAHWLGQHDRARLVNSELAKRAMANGALPHLQPTGRTRRDFGGADGFYAWQIQQHRRHVGDDAFVRNLAPTLRASLANTLAEYDPNANGLLAWGLQINNQEDFVGTPHDGTSPTMALLAMIDNARVAEELAGNREEAARLEASYQRSLNGLRQHLVDAQLGRPIYMFDEDGVTRPDGPYHSLVFPTLAGVLSPETQYTTLRHLHDRLTGPEGETYASNNFADHLPELWATWGMQAGAMQQPWAAMAYNKAGMTERVLPPLAWIAGKVHNNIQRGTWPEVANEQRPGYFTTPAALWIQAVVEALFGLQVDMPRSTLVIQPCFPEAWASARLTLPEYEATYSREGNVRRYRVVSQRSLVREIRWPVSMGAAVRATINGSPVEAIVEPGVEVSWVCVTTVPQTATEIELIIEEPAPVERSLPASMSVTEALAAGDVAAADVLERAEPFGRMGSIVFSRRTIFEPQAEGGSIPRDYLVLPDVEMAALAAATITKEGLAVEALLRNNTREAINGEVVAHGFAGRQARVPVAVAPRSEARVILQWPAADPVAPGEHRVIVDLPHGNAVEFVALVPASPESPMAFEEVALPPELLVEDALYLGWRRWYHGHNDLFKSPVSPLHDLKTTVQIESPELPGVVFPGLIDKLVVVGGALQPPQVRIPVESPRPIHKVYLLTLSLVDQHDMYTPVSEVALVHPANEAAPLGTRIAAPLTVRRLHYPGDLDAFFPEGTLLRLATYAGPRAQRHGLLPLVAPESSDWPADIAKPPRFPNAALWASSAVVSTPNAIFNIVEITPPRPLHVDAIDIRMINRDAAMGVAGIVVATSPP